MELEKIEEMKKEVLLVLENDGLERALEKFAEYDFAQRDYKILFMKLISNIDSNFHYDYDLSCLHEFAPILNACRKKGMSAEEQKIVSDALLDDVVHKSIKEKYRSGQYNTGRKTGYHEDGDNGPHDVYEKVPVDCAWAAKKSLQHLEKELSEKRREINFFISFKKDHQAGYLKQCLDMVGKEEEPSGVM